jgi:hypothetical protein
LLIASLMAVSLLLFVGGVVWERSAAGSQERREVSCAQQHAGTGEGTGEGSERGGEHGAAACVQHTSEVARETVLGVNLEDPGVVAAIAVGWLVLMVGLLRVGRLALPVVAVAAGVALLFDVLEVARQIGLGHGGVAVVAALVAAGHAAVAVLAVLVLTGHAGAVTDVLRPVAARLAGPMGSTPTAAAEAD